MRLKSCKLENTSGRQRETASEISICRKARNKSLLVGYDINGDLHVCGLPVMVISSLFRDLEILTRCLEINFQ